jgi:hypothetical protein
MSQFVGFALSTVMTDELVKQDCLNRMAEQFPDVSEATRIRFSAARRYEYAASEKMLQNYLVCSFILNAIYLHQIDACNRIGEILLGQWIPLNLLQS